MADLIKVENQRYDEYESLLLERDQLLKEAGQMWTVYTQIFGQLIAEDYEMKLECIKRKKMIAYYQNAINHGGQVDQDAMKEYLDKEMSSYYENLKRLIDDNNRCKDAGTSTEYEVQRSKTIYRRIAKLVHPDINPATDKNEYLSELWARVVLAYGKNSIKELTELEVLIRKALKEQGQENVKIDIPDIEDKIDALKKEINEIKSTDPYQYKYLLDDDEAVAEKKKALEDDLKNYTAYRDQLDQVINDLLANGGLTITWRMN